MTARKTASEKLQDEVVPEVELPEAALLKPIGTIRLRQRQNLIDLMKAWMERSDETIDAGDGSIDISDLNDRLADIQDALEPLAVDPDAFIEWSNANSMALAQLFVKVAAEVGDSMRSRN